MTEARPPSPGGVIASYGDLAAAVLLSLLTVGLAGLEGLSGLLGLVRVLLGVFFVFVIPGYTLSAALFPSIPESSRKLLFASSDQRSTAPSPAAERLVLSIGLSLTAFPLIALFWNFTTVGISQSSVLGSVAFVTIIAAAVAAYRRARVSTTRRSNIRYGERLRTALSRSGGVSKGVNLSNLLLAALIMVAIAGMGLALATAESGERYTEFYLLSENETGALVADDYPTEFTRGDPETLYVGIGNQESEEINYTVVVELQRISSAEAGTGTVTDKTEIDRFHVSLAPNETYRRSHTVTPSTTGQDLRLTYLLYRGEPPAAPTTATAYREVHLWVNVTT